jgi:uncharacterized repeat protein (TIGR01451 family)
MKKNIVWLLWLATLLLWYGTVSAQSIPTIGSTMTTSTISQPYQQSQCVEPDGSIVYVNRQFYLWDTYTTTDIVPKWGNGYDTLLLNASKVYVYNPALFNFSSAIQWKSNGIPNNAPVNSMVSAQGTFVVSSTSPWQLVYNIHRTALENAWSSNYSIAYLGRTNLVNYTAQLSNKTFHNQAWRVVNGYECVNYIVHYCGDGVVDTQQSIAALPWGSTSSIANEQCDGTAWVPAGYSCSSTCTLQTVTPPQQLQCILTVTPGSVSVNQVVSVWRKVTGGNFLWTYIYVSPSIGWAWPHWINANQYTGTSSVMPTQAGNYTFSMTVSNNQSSASCTWVLQVLPGINTWVSLTKTLINDVPYHSGDLVSFRIDFANNWPTTVNNVVLSDNLPGGLDYVSSQIFGVAPYTMGTGMSGWTQLLQYSGFSLTPGQAGYFIVVGRFKWYAYSTQNMNHVYLSASNIATLYANALFHPYIPSANATITKTVDKVSYTPGEDARFAITVINNGPDAIDNVQIIDVWPNSSCIVIDGTWTWGGSVPMTMINSGAQPYTWNLASSLPVGQSVYLYLLGHIANNQSCVGTYTNVVNLKYTVNGQLKTSQASVTINVITAPNASMTIEKKIVQYGNTSGDPIIFELLYRNNGTTTISSYDIVDYWPGTLNFVSATPSPTTQTPSSWGSLLRWVFTSPILPNGSGKILINGTIK